MFFQCLKYVHKFTYIFMKKLSHDFKIQNIIALEIDDKSRAIISNMEGYL